MTDTTPNRTLSSRSIASRSSRTPSAGTTSATATPPCCASTCSISTPPRDTGSSATTTPRRSRSRRCDYYFDRLRETVLPNVHNLQNCFRSHGLEVIHVRIQSLTKDGRDRGKGHKRLELHAAPGSGDACFLEEVAPVGDEIVINKTASGVFSSTNLHYVLQQPRRSARSTSSASTPTSASKPPSATPATSAISSPWSTTAAPRSPPSSTRPASRPSATDMSRIVYTTEAIDEIERSLPSQRL